MTSLFQAQRAVNLVKIPDQTGKTFLVTGGNVGIGYEVVKALAAKNAHVFMTARDAERQQGALQKIKREHPGAHVEGLHVDYMNGFGDIADCVKEFKSRNLPLHGLINNIGVENPPDIKSKEGFDPTQASNYLGHFYLTHLLLEKLMDTPRSRVVNLTSLVEPNGGVEWTDIGGTRVQRSGYQMYADSKLMLYMFGAELQKRLRSMGSSTDVFNAHPGVAQTDAFRKSDKSKIAARVLKSGADFIGQSPGGAAQSIMKCATDPSLTGMGGGDRHWGSWYTGIPIKPFGVTLPLCFTVNWNNYGFRSPISPLIYDPEACSKLYTATMDLVNEHASTKIEACGRSNATIGRH
ncbi:hypothetical protein ABBQ32_000194 [Trebouxia sp. C0010 RCD-2024]